MPTRLTKAQRKEVREMSAEDQLELVREELHQDAEVWYEAAKQSEGFKEMLISDICYGNRLLRPPQR